MRENISKKYRYKADTSCVLQPNLSEEEKLHRLWAHSEKMALAWALLSLPKKGDIIMHNNLRVCNDCHTTLKLISKLFKRKLVMANALVMIIGSKKNNSKKSIYSIISFF